MRMFGQKKFMIRLAVIIVKIIVVVVWWREVGGLGDVLVCCRLKSDYINIIRGSKTLFFTVTRLRSYPPVVIVEVVVLEHR